MFLRSDTRTNKRKRWLEMLTFCMMIFIGQTGFAQSVATQTFSANGYDDSASTQLVITPSSITVNEGQPIQSVVITGFSGHYNSPTGSDGCWATSPNSYDWFSFNLNITGGVSNGTSLNDICSDSIIGTTVTGFTNITVSTNDTDFWSDMVYFNLTLEVTFEAPTCPVPTALTVNNITQNSAVLEWTSEGNLFDIEWGTAGFTPTETPNGTNETGVTNPFTLEGLTPATDYEFYVRQDCGDDGVSNWVGPFSFTTECLPPSITGTTPDTICGIGEATLSATADTGTIAWYDSETGGNKLGEGETFTTPVISETTSYWVSAKLGSGGFGGKLTPNAGATASTTNNWGIRFTLTEEVTLTSVDVYSTAAGTLDVKITDGSGVELYSTGNISISNGGLTTPNVIPLSFTAPAGNYRILIKSYTGVSIIRDNSSVTFPYTSPDGILTATSSEWGGSTTDYYYYFYNIGYSAGCSSERTEVIATVNDAPDFELSENAIEICEGDTSAAITIATGAADYDTFVWEPSTEVSGDETNGWTFNPTETTTYTLTASQSEGAECMTTLTLEVIVNPLPVAITTAASQDEICQNETIELSVTGNIHSGTAVFGEGTTAPGGTSWPNPFSKWYGGTKHQMLFTTDELTAQGLIAGSEITAVTFDIAAIGTSTNNIPCTDFTIRMGNTSVTEMTSFVSGTTNVYGPQTFTPTTTGIVIFNLTTPYVWDGTSNIVVETVHNTGTSGGGSGTNTRASATNNNSVYRAASDGVAGGVPGFDALTSYDSSGANNQRPNMTFIHSIEQTMITWSPAADLYLDEEATQPYEEDSYALAVYYKPSTWGMNTYTATSYTELGCSVSSSVEITVHSTETPVGESEQVLTEGQTLADLVVEGENLVWYADEDLTDMIPNTTVPVTGIYYVTTEAGDCTSGALAINVTMMLCSELGIPTGEATQTLTEGQTLADLVVEGENLQWYADEDLTEELEDTHVAEDDTTYYVTQTIGLCTSEALAVTVDVTLGRTDFETFAFRFYPNPVGDVLNLTSNSEISQINLFNMLGQKVTVVANANNTQVDMSGLPTGNYIISITIEGVTKTFKVVKN